MRRALFGLGTAQILLTGAALSAYAVIFTTLAWDSAVILGFGLSMSSTAIVMMMLVERGETRSEHGKAAFAVLLMQDLAVVAFLVLVPILAHTSTHGSSHPIWEHVLAVLGALVGVFLAGRYLLPTALAWATKRHDMQAFAVITFLAVFAAAWVMDLAGASMTLGAFLIGMLLSASDYRYHIESLVAPFKGTLLGAFFIAVGMSIDVSELLTDWAEIILDVGLLLLIKIAVLLILGLAFGLRRSAAVRTAFLLPQAGEFGFVLFGAAAASGLLSPDTFTLALLVIAVSMILTPFMAKAGDRLASLLEAVLAAEEPPAPTVEEVERHVVVVGYDRVGQLLCMMLETLEIPYVAFDMDVDRVRQGKEAGHKIHFGDMREPAVQQSAGVGTSAAVVITLETANEAKRLAISLRQLYEDVSIHVRVHTFDQVDALVAKGIQFARPVYIESTLLFGREVVDSLGVPEEEINDMVESFRRDNYSLVRALATSVAAQE